VRGLNLEIWGGYEVIRDQLYLPAEGASPEEIIARQRALATAASMRWADVARTLMAGH